jgi:hypothetical protein
MIPGIAAAMASASAAAASLEDRQEVFARLRRRFDPRGDGSVGARRGAETPAPLATGLPGIDAALGGGLPRGALTELVFAAPSSGGQLVLLNLLHAARRSHRFIALVDGADSFDPQTVEPPSLLRHLLWVRCGAGAGAGRVNAALRAADLLARDSNFALLALDLRGCDARELRRTPSTVWYRLQRVIEPTDTVFTVFTPRRLVPAARARLAFHRSLPLTSLVMEQADIGEQLAPEVDRLRNAVEWSEETDAPDLSLTRSRSRSCSPTLPRSGERTESESDYDYENDGQVRFDLLVAEAAG